MKEALTISHPFEKAACHDRGAGNQNTAVVETHRKHGKCFPNFSLNHLKRVVCLALAFVMLLPMLPGHLPLAFAANDDHVVTYGDNQTKGFVKFSEAWNFADSVNGTIDMHADAFLGRQLKLSKGHKVTLNMNGYMINRGKTNKNNIKEPTDSDGDGTIFYLNPESHLTINGGKDSASQSRIHAGQVISGVWYYDGSGSQKYYGALLTGSGSNSYSCGAITMDNKAKLDVYDVTIAGNVCDTWFKFYGEGAVIKLRSFASDAKIHMERCRISNNFARDYGAVIFAHEHENAKIELIDCDISNNSVEKDGAVIYIDSRSTGATIDLKGSNIYSNSATNGGAIYLGAEDCTIKNGHLVLNNAREYGGAVYIGAKHCTIDGGCYEANYAKKDGGGIFLYGIENTARNAEIISNEAGNRGGGIFVTQEDCFLSGCTITQNKAASKGGGVYLNTTNVVYVPKLQLGGKLIIKENTVGGKNNNLYLEKTTNTFYRATKIFGIPDKESEIWVTSAFETGAITYTPDSYNDYVFHSDNTKYNVYWEQDRSKSEEYRHLVIGTGETLRVQVPGVTLNPGVADFTYTGINQLEPTSYGYKNWPVYKGYGREDSPRDISAYYYSDGYFQTNAKEYNEHLATLSLRMAAAGFNSGVWSDTAGTGWGYKLQPIHVKQMLSDIGVADEDIYLSESFFVKPGMDSIGYAIGSKKLLDKDGNDSGMVLVPVVVRGQGYEMEWASNVTLGFSGLHMGFNDAATTVFNQVKTYLADRPDIQTKLNEGKVRFWVVGFSRAGATANLVSKKLIDEYQSKKNVVYGYTFEAPQGGVDSEKKKGADYTTIHNIVLPGDLVPNVAMIAMGFQRYGVDHYLPGTAASTPVTFTKRYYNELSAGKKNQSVFTKDNTAFEVGSEMYEAQKKIMLRQLAASDPNKVFDDYFHLATLGVRSTYEKEKWLEIGNGNVSMENWLADFTYYLNEWLVNEPLKGKLHTDDARAFYAQSEQDTVRRLMELFMGDDGMNTDRALDRIVSFSFISKAIYFLRYNSGFADFEQKMLNLCFDEKIFADDAIPLDRTQAEAVVDIVCRVAWGDLTFLKNYSKGTTVPYGDVWSIENLIMFPTLLYNVERILLNHRTGVVFAWLRSYDSYYTKNSDGISDHYLVGNQADKSMVEQPYLSYELNGVKHTLKAGETLTILDTDKLTNMALCNAEKNQGGMIFYDMAFGSDKKLKPENYYTGAKIFGEKNKEITIEDNSAVITAKTIWHDAPSENATFNIIVEKDSNHKVYILKPGENPSNTETGYDFYAVVEEDKDTRVEVVFEEGWEINRKDSLGWNYYTADNHTVAYRYTWGTPAADGTILLFRMPGEDIYLVPEWVHKQVDAPVFSMKGGEWSHDLSVKLSTPSGTEADGFSIRYWVESKSPDYDSEYGTGDYTYPLIMFGSENGKVTWKLKAQAFHEGWLDSPVSEINYTINYRNQSFNVNVVGGTLADTGKSTGKYYLGDVVKINAAVPEKSTFEKWTVDPANVKIKNDAAVSTSFTMPYHDVTITASFNVPEVPAPIYVEGGDAYNEVSEKITEAIAGQRVYLMARDPQADSDGYETERFTSWTSPDSVAFEDALNGRTSFVMPVLSNPVNGVNLKANFQKLFKITVNNGYAANDDGNIVAYAAKGDRIIITPEGMDNPERIFSQWDFATVPADGLDLTHTSISFDMPAWDVTATAIFQRLYKITVNNGYASNAAGNTVTYASEGEKITITAKDMDETEHVFSQWKFSTVPTGVSNRKQPTLTFSMPARDITATAKFQGVHKITVINGYAKNAAGSIVNHAVKGETITIMPNDTDDPKHVFSKWSFAKVPSQDLDLKQRSISFSMPEQDVTATADFQGMYEITVTNGYAMDENGKIVTYAAEDDRITIVPNDTDIFSKWDFETVPTGDLDLTRRSLSFDMPDHDVKATAVFQKKTTMRKIAVTNGYAVNETGSVVTQAAPGEKITIIPNSMDDPGYAFKNWEFNTIPAGVPDLVHRNLSFDMPDRDVTAEAFFQKVYKINITNGYAVNFIGSVVPYAAQGDIVTIIADDADSLDYTFSKWDSVTLPEGTELTQPSLWFKMPSWDVTATATFKNAYKITITNGYAVNAAGKTVTYAAPGEKITIIPDEADNQEHTFVTWESATLPAGMDLTQRSLSFDMPSWNVTANAKIKYAIQVIHGHAEDAYGKTITAAFAGDKVILVPDAPPAGMFFDHWQISNGLRNTSNRSKLLELVLSVASADDSTTLTGNELIMPKSAVTAEAIYSKTPVVPQTGDNSNPVLWTLLGIGLVLCLIYLQSKGRKKESR